MAALLPAAITALGTLGGAWFGARSGRKTAEKTAKKQKEVIQKQAKETKTQKMQRHLIDELIGSVKGKGRFADLFNENTAKRNERFDPSNEAFQKSFVQPAQSLFRNQLAPQIQQKYIQSGQQGSSGLDDQLLRAGVDLDSLLNQHMMEFQQGAYNRQQNAFENASNRRQNMIGTILGYGGRQNPQLSNIPVPPTGGDFGSAFGDFTQTKAFPKLIKSGVDYFTKEDRPGFKSFGNQNNL